MDLGHTPVIIVHGGVGTYATVLTNPLERGLIEKGVEEAAWEGYQTLLAGGNALDAVEIAVRLMEDNPIFNAGRF